MTAHLAVRATADNRRVLTLVDPVELPPPHNSQLVWRRTLDLAETFEQRHTFTVVLEVLRTARYDVVTMAHALAIGHAHLRDQRDSLVAWRAAGLLGRAIAFLGGQQPAGNARPAGPTTTSPAPTPRHRVRRDLIRRDDPVRYS